MFSSLLRRFSASGSTTSSEATTDTATPTAAAAAPAPAPPGGATNSSSSLSSSSSSSSSSTSTTSTPSDSKGLNGGDLDLVFLVDCTGSMSSYIQSAQKSIQTIVEKIVQSEKASVQFGIVGYRDWSDSWTTHTYPFTSSIKVMRSNIDQLSASGGGDAPEAITAGLADVVQLPFRKNSTRICVLIGDAPDHGLGESGDSYPQGDPKGRDPVVIARQLADLGVVLYSVGCEPALSSSSFGRDFFMMLARITGGQYLPLASSHLLPQAIISGAKEELSLDRLTDKMEAEMKQVKADADKAGEKIEETEVVKRVFANMKAKGVTAQHTRVDALWDSSKYNDSNVAAMENAPTLAAARAAMKSGLNRHVQVDASCAAKQTAYAEVAEVSYEQVHRAYHRAAKTKWS